MDNTSKIIWYLRLVTKEPIQIDGREEFMGIKKISLSPTFFHSDDCQVCGDCCCVHEDNVYTQFEYDKIMNMTDEEFRAEGYIFTPEGFDPTYLQRLKSMLHSEIHIINGKEVPLYIAPVDKNVKLTCTHCPPRKEGFEYPRCTWTRRDPDGLTKCSIHPVRSITCDMPHVRFIYQRGGSLSIGITQYGRNWAIGCPLKFYPPKDENEWQTNKDNRIRKLKHLNQNAMDLGIETWLPEVIEYAEAIPYEGYESYLGKHIVCTDGSEEVVSKPHASARKLFSI